MSLIYNLGKSSISESGVKDHTTTVNKTLINIIIEDLENMTDILNKSNGNHSVSKGDYLKAEINKKIEDGILDSIHKANTHQLNVLLNYGYRFKYYTELNDMTKLRNEIQSRIRNAKIEKIL